MFVITSGNSSCQVQKKFSRDEKQKLELSFWKRYSWTLQDDWIQNDFFLISKTFLSEIFKLSFAECWMESRKNIMKMCHEHTILIFNFTQHSSGLFCVSVCSVLSNTNTSPSFIFRVQDVAFIASCLYQMLEPLRDEHKLRKPWCVPI